jgi:hypothetical protein
VSVVEEGCERFAADDFDCLVNFNRESLNVQFANFKFLFHKGRLKRTDGKTVKKIIFYCKNDATIQYLALN